jgi:putative Ca2+/H+ antiporter (TMEM165/GDT1 family)
MSDYECVELIEFSYFIMLQKRQGKDGKSKAWPSVLRVFFSHVFIEAFTLTFLAEWGDRSQVSTIVLAARDVSHSSFELDGKHFLSFSKEVLTVMLGGTLGNILCTSIAVLGGHLVAQRISVRTGEHTASMNIILIIFMHVSCICFINFSNWRIDVRLVCTISNISTLRTNDKTPVMQHIKILIC